ncbi:MAG: CBS domain-containing protein, partial [Burkholderiales bacterium]|nr:CBS domain-containing protein [Burkholderiales bacterium]
LDVGALPVQEPEGELVGIVTDRDIAVRAVAEGMDPNGSTVSQIMTPQVQTCSANRDIADAARLMETRRIRRLVVVDASGAPVGMISLGDLALHAPGAKLPVSALKGVSKPKAPD